MTLRNYIVLLLGVISMKAFNQATVEIDFNCQKYIGNVSTLDRTKYFNMHSSSTDAEHTALGEDYNVTLGGRGFWGPHAWASASTCCGKTPMPDFPAYTPGSTNNTVRSVKHTVQTQHPHSAIHPLTDPVEAGNWAVEYYLDIESNTPEYFEPMNEPFVHAGDADFKANYPDNFTDNDMRGLMANYFAEIGKAIHNEPLLANMKVVGYSSAWPMLEKWDFGHWDSRMKMFMDVAGEHMDAFATHLYDGVNVGAGGGRRSGSNAQAILDLIETYSYIKWDEIKPHAITEYGGITDDSFDAAYPGYHPIKSVQTIKSANHILFDLLDREDRMEISIPFITGKATWHLTEANDYQPYGATLFIPTTIGEAPPGGNVNNYTWTYSPKINFYKLWLNVEGDRVHITSDNPDIQTQAFVSGSNLYVALNNLDDYEQNVNLNFLSDISEFNSSVKKSLIIYPDKECDYTEENATAIPTEITMAPGETTVLELSFNSAISFNNTIHSKSYYNKNYLKTINAGAINGYIFTDVDTSAGYATIKLGLGRNHNLSKIPELIVNGNTVEVPTNYAGYDQANREDGFFGTIDIPIPMEYIKPNDTVIFKFPDTGGRISHVILEVGNFESKPEWYTNVTEKSVAEYKIYPNPGNGNISIQTENNPGSLTVEVFDIIGQKRISENFINQKHINLQLKGILETGTYFIVLSNNTDRFTKTLIIK